MAKLPQRKATVASDPSDPGVPAAPPAKPLHGVWPAILAALILVPWLIAGTIYLRQSTAPPAAEASSRAESASARSLSPGPWGQITLTPILISPPLEYVADDWGRVGGPDEWHFPGTPVDVVEAFLLSSGLSPLQVSRARVNARRDPRTNGIIVRPDPEMVRNLSQELRARIYLELGKTSLNFDQANAFRFYGATSEAWLAGSRISAETRKLVEPLIYRDGEFLLFADPEIVRSQISDPEELRRLAKTLLRQSTVLAKLSIEDPSQIPALAEYWGRGGRRTDLRPLLESVVESVPDRSIDIVHLLPTFARNQLYRYPRTTAADLNKPLLANCLWSSLNFFSNQPDDRFLDVNTALNTLKKDYYIVESGFQLGDIVAMLDGQGNLFHVAVYLADGLVFSKNGTSPVSPWAITTVDQLKGYYRSRAANPRLIYHRRHDH